MFGQNRLRSAQREKVRLFINCTQTAEKTAIYCLQVNDWKLEQASDSYFANPDFYHRQDPNFNKQGNADRKKLDQLYLRYRGELREYDLYLFARKSHSMD